MTNFARKNIWLAAGFALAQLAAPAAWATDYNVGPIQISAPWARATPKGATAGAAYMTITNTGKTPDKVNGVMQMRPVEGGLEIKPGETVTLKPGSFHMMLVNLKHPLEQGNTIKATLKFDAAGTIDVDYPIAGIGAAAPGVPAGGGTMMMQGGGGMQMNKP
jgi:periplasmic copper chaperone A